MNIDNAHTGNGNVEECIGSELGTKIYWESHYNDELNNYKNNGVIGDIWFEEESQFRVINWMLKLKDLFKFEDSIIDVGCGNGMMLIELHRAGFKNLTGVDYTIEAIDLSKSIAHDQEMDIEFKVIDLLQDESLDKIGQYKIVHDKGTYDAISLHPIDTKTKRTIYINALHKITADNGYLILTSCNWTEPELLECFKGKYDKAFTIPTPTFKFGGEIGNVVTTIVFKKL